MADTTFTHLHWLKLSHTALCETSWYKSLEDILHLSAHEEKEMAVGWTVLKTIFSNTQKQTKNQVQGNMVICKANI